jgi:hypothetical protein
MIKDTQHYPVYDDGSVYTRNPLEAFDVPIEETEEEERRAIFLRYPEITNYEYELLKEARRSDRMKKIAYAKHLAELEFARQITIRADEETSASSATAMYSKTKMKTTTSRVEESSSSSFSATSQQPPSSNPDILKAREFYNKSNGCYSTKFTDMRSLEECESYLNTLILYQPDAVADISRALWMLKDDSVFGDPKPCIYPLLMVGTTGTGKTHSVNIMRNVLEMDIHCKHADCYIEYRFGNCSDDSTLNQLTGASPGYLGFKDKECETLCDKLKRACKHYEDVLSHVDPWYTSPLPKGFFDDDNDDGSGSGDDEEAVAAKKRPFCVVLLFIDEADKATRKIWNILNSFLSDGCITDSSNGKIFTIPRGIKVLVCITGNFASDMMISENANNEDHYDDVKEWVLMDLKRKGYADCDITRFAKDIIPFFPPSRKDINIILMTRFYKHLLSDENRFNKKYGQATIKDDDLVYYIRTLIEKYNQQYGIRQAHDTLDKDLKQFAGQNLHHFDTYLGKQSSPLDPPPQLSFKSIPFSENLSQEELGRTDPDINIAVRDSVNLRNLKRRLKSKNNVDFLTMSHPLIAEPCVNILNANQTTIVYNYNDNRQYNDPNLLEKFERVLNEKKDCEVEKICLGNALREVCNIIECDEDTKEYSGELKRKVDQALVHFLPKRKSSNMASIHTSYDIDGVQMIEEKSYSTSQSPLQTEEKDNEYCLVGNTTTVENDNISNMVIMEMISPSPSSSSSPPQSPTHYSPNRNSMVNANAYPLISSPLHENGRYSPSLLYHKQKRSHESGFQSSLLCSGVPMIEEKGGLSSESTLIETEKDKGDCLVDNTTTVENDNVSNMVMMEENVEQTRVKHGKKRKKNDVDNTEKLEGQVHAKNVKKRKLVMDMDKVEHDNDVVTKTCSSCRQTKNIKDFRKGSRCRECDTLYLQAYRKSIKAKDKEHYV